MFRSFEIAARLLQLKLGAVDFGQSLAAFNLEIFVVKPTEELAVENLVSDGDRQFGDPAVHFRPDGNLGRRSDVARGIDHKANIARFHHRCGRPVGSWPGLLNRRTMAPQEVSSSAQSSQN